MEKVNYGGWPNCIRLSNGKIELIATTDVGPRIIRFGFVGSDNEFHEDPEQMGQTGGDEWKSYGGHRFWLAPEAKPRSYYPDNSPVTVEADGDAVRLISDVETNTGMQKELRVTLSATDSHVAVVHKVTNRSLWPVELAPWGLSVMRAGGMAIFPEEGYAPHPDIPDYPGQETDVKYYLPVRSLVLWSYTDLADPRWKFTSRYLILKQDPHATKPQKIGLSNHRGWAAYARRGHLFVKKVLWQHDCTYPDNGSIFETFTNSDMLELESLGPIVTLEPGASVSHREDWYLFDGVNFEETDESIDLNVVSKVKTVL